LKSTVVWWHAGLVPKNALVFTDFQGYFPRVLIVVSLDRKCLGAGC
jgi:hypothetical protein